MPPKGIKRKAPSSPVSTPPSKKAAPATTNPAPDAQIAAQVLTNGGTNHGTNHGNYDHSRLAEEYGIVQREFYPPELSSERCELYNRNEIPRPIEVLEGTITSTASARNAISAGDAVVHWFKRDLRTTDNRPLHLASEKAKTMGVPLICIFIVSPQDYQAHLTSAVRVDFELRTLEVMKEELASLDIPLFVEIVEKRKKIPNRVVELCEQWGAKHIFAGIEYEVDELRREVLMTNKCLERGISFTALHDDVVVPPGTLSTGQGKQYSVYSPWFRSWVSHIHSDPECLLGFDAPSRNPSVARAKFAHVFEMSIPSAPSNKSLTEEERVRFKSMWPAGEHEAQERLEKFLSEKVGKYKDMRNFPAANSTAVLSVHFSTGTLAARTAIRRGRDVNSTKRLDGGIPGIMGWISEVAWRDFYKHVLAHWPYVCMNKPFKHEYAHIEWQYDMALFEKWCQGRTGFPIVDAAMRQLLHMGYMHNRCRMIVASFLAKDLLIDWRMGERHFMEHLVDGDFASNNGGWGFAASTGVDPQPYFRIFNPLLQSEKFDADGEYIRHWIPELKHLHGKAIHDPYGRGEGKLAEKMGYPKPCVDHKASREKALAMYKTGLGKDTA